MSKDARQFGLETWHVILVTAAIAGVFGMLLIVRPFQSRFAAHIIAGGALIAEGVKNQWVVIFAVKAAKNRLPETMED